MFGSHHIQESSVFPCWLNKYEGLTQGQQRLQIQKMTSCAPFPCLSPPRKSLVKGERLCDNEEKLEFLAPPPWACVLPVVNHYARRRVIYCADTCPHAFRHPSLQMGGDKVKQIPSLTQQSQAQLRQCNLFTHAPF